ncbi:hypothetical protein, partial [Alistipes putredinis]|uniref:hypothetical protein n=1 Tax=Alistipes putredinis TaxID=28117 RepID=UPI003A838907
MFAAEFHIGKDSDKPEANANLFAFCRGDMFGVKDSESEANRAGLYAKIAEPHPIFDKYKDSESREEN